MELFFPSGERRRAHGRNSRNGSCGAEGGQGLVEGWNRPELTTTHALTHALIGLLPVAKRQDAPPQSDPVHGGTEMSAEEAMEEFKREASTLRPKSDKDG